MKTTERRSIRLRLAVASAAWVAAAAALAIGVFFAARDLENTALGLGTVVVGVPLYFIWRGRAAS